MRQVLKYVKHNPDSSGSPVQLCFGGVFSRVSEEEAREVLGQLTSVIEAIGIARAARSKLSPEEISALGISYK